MIPEPRPGWRDDRACKRPEHVSATRFTATFYPSTASKAPVEQFCGACPVRVDCLAHALIHREDFGVWGGESERSRRRLERRLRRGTLTWAVVAAGGLWDDWAPPTPVAVRGR